jgi:septal ring factor EnvC (AmiA/AmiB activator)
MWYPKTPQRTSISQRFATLRQQLKEATDKINSLTNEVTRLTAELEHTKKEHDTKKTVEILLRG